MLWLVAIEPEALKSGISVTPQGLSNLRVAPIRPKHSIARRNVGRRLASYEAITIEWV